MPCHGGGVGASTCGAWQQLGMCCEALCCCCRRRVAPAAALRDALPLLAQSPSVGLLSQRRPRRARVRGRGGGGALSIISVTRRARMLTACSQKAAGQAPPSGDEMDFRAPMSLLRGKVCPSSFHVSFCFSFSFSFSFSLAPLSAFGGEVPLRASSKTGAAGNFSQIYDAMDDRPKAVEVHTCPCSCPPIGSCQVR
eukprot:COSAG01_NODE_1830_length_9121_cov_96.924074_3_plen_196_part_00